MGQLQHTPTIKPGGRRLRPRTCLRKECDRIFQPIRWNQRYCQEAECLRQVRRWQAAKRQRVHRRALANRKRHAEAEAQRRRRARSEMVSKQESPPKSGSDTTAGSAWSRSKRILADFCDRPGCYEPLLTESRAPARYCSCGCRQAMRRVLDRERKWLVRNRYAEQLESPRVPHEAKPQSVKLEPATCNASSRSVSVPVRGYGVGHKKTLSSSRFEHQEPRSPEKDDDSETHLGYRSRPPPSF